MASADVDITSRPIPQDPSAPDAQRPQTGSNTAAARDELDDLFNYDAQIDDVYRDVENNAAINARAPEPDVRNSSGLGIDEEVKVRKPRAPIVKLDEDKLLSAKGIPKLRKISKERIRFRGKGHEFSDVARLLNMYQLWLDDLFPKAKFADGLSIVEKLGHKKRLQVMRKEWIQEDRPKLSRDIPSEDEDFIDRNVDTEVDTGGHETAQNNDLQTDGNNVLGYGTSNQDQDAVMQSSVDDEDLYGPPSPRPGAQPLARDQSNDGPEDDELDQLLAEDALKRSKAQVDSPVTPSGRVDEHDDDEEVMAELGW